MCEKSFDVYPFILYVCPANRPASRIFVNKLTSTLCPPASLYTWSSEQFLQVCFLTASDRFTLVDLANNIIRRGDVFGMNAEYSWNVQTAILLGAFDISSAKAKHFGLN